jgi:hypothetical protein
MKTKGHIESQRACPAMHRANRIKTGVMIATHDHFSENATHSA